MIEANTVIPYETLGPYNRFRDTADPCSNNHKQNTESVSGWHKTFHGLARMQKLVFAEVEKAHPEPITPKEIAAKLDLAFAQYFGQNQRRKTERDFARHGHHS
jgi:hypothetical protein